MSNDANLPTWAERFREFVSANLPANDPGHDLAHIQRVVANAARLAGAERADPTIVLPAAWLHDCVPVDKRSPDRPRASLLSAKRAATFLSEIGYPPRAIPAVEHAIAAHSFSAGIAATTLEARVVQDADRLDALGAVGLARCLMLGGSWGLPLYNPVEPVPATRPADDRRFVLDHFYQKLLALPERMTTSSGRAEAMIRAGFLRQFVAQLISELDCPLNHCDPNCLPQTPQREASRT